jgi:hypothetical protein
MTPFSHQVPCLGRKIAVIVFCLLAVLVTAIAWSGMSVAEILARLFGS